MSHSHYTGMTPATMTVIGNLIDYARSVGVEIVSAKEGFARFANAVAVPDENVSNPAGFVVDPFGKVKAMSGIGCGFSVTQIHDYYSPVSSYEENNITEERIITKTAMFPHGVMGVLRTHRTGTNMIQTFIPYGYQEIWVRKVTGTDIPQEFTCMTSLAGEYSNRSTWSYEKIGNCYYDTTNLRPIYCKTAGKKTTTKLTVTSGATSAGNIKIGTPLGDKTIAVTAGETALEIANAIAQTSFAGYAVIQSSENPLVIYLTRAIAQSMSHCTFADTDTTGTSITVSNVVNGVTPAWVDASGNDLT